MTRRLADEVTDWRSLARCAETDPEAFFLDPGESPTVALQVCAGCAVRSECLDWALEHRERHGVWGGTTPQERESILRARARADRRAVPAAVTTPVAAAPSDPGGVESGAAA